MAALQRPPIPQAPLVDEKGFVTREWWRWFASIGVVVAEQGSQISDTKTTIDNVVVFDAPLAPLDDPVDTTDVVRQSLALRLLQDALSTTTIDPDQAALRALELTLQQDPLPLDQLALTAQLLRQPADPAALDQATLAALALSPLPDALRRDIGSFVSSEVAITAVSLTSTVAVDLTSIALGPGDWDVWGVAGFAEAAGAAATQLKAWISTTSATPATFPNGGAFVNNTITYPAASNEIFPVGTKRISLSAAATVYISCVTTFAGGTMTGGAGIYARLRA